MLFRDEVLEKVKKVLMGPDPLPGYAQENGDEILYFDSPLKTYVTGILFPQFKSGSGLAEEETEIMDTTDEYIGEDNVSAGNTLRDYQGNVAEPAIDEETSKTNNFQQSAMGITVCVPKNAREIRVRISAGTYEEKDLRFPREVRNDEGVRQIVLSDKTKTCYVRKQHNMTVGIPTAELPKITRIHRNDYDVINDEDGACEEGLNMSVTFRMENAEEDYIIYTFTLVNSKKTSRSFPRMKECWYQVSFSVECEAGFDPLPDNFCSDITDTDYKLNALLYRKVRTYGIGHGCAATWDDEKETRPKTIHATALPEYEVKPIEQGTTHAELSMITYAEDFEKTCDDLTVLCDEYSAWIEERKKEAATLDERFAETAALQIKQAEECLRRMLGGINLLKTDSKVRTAFQLANRAMLMQQIHYQMPLRRFTGFDSEELEYVMEEKTVPPDENDPKTWYHRDAKNPTVYGRWRPFQIAFILLNLASMNDHDCNERKIVDLIWFPTGGGKTEAYLGLTAYTILLRRLKDPTDSGTTVIMRYTLRLLTAQQYERASALICSLEHIREENPDKLGTDRITVGLWVGGSLTDNDSSDALKRMRAIRQGTEKGNVSVVLKCPWCGASMETFDSGTRGRQRTAAHTPGYEIAGNKVLLRCGNPDCEFHDENRPLPLMLFDDEIYESPPTLLFGTVDKFAMLPFRPQAKSLFGGDGEHTPPELIIQDELHLITGPLGSAVGLYETLIHELCSAEGRRPKVIASTATISHARQQCNALYDCGEDNVFQFPVPGLDYRDCFFAEEKPEKTGRKYIGLYGSGASTSATASIYTFAALLYAVKAVPTGDGGDALRDPYWTNLCYFGSMRELGQAATWYIADVRERLEVLYQNRLEVMLDADSRRYLYEDGLEELTSRMSNTEIPQILKKLEVTNTTPGKKALNMCLATNMVSVGVDVSRLGLMTVTGQPKSFSEYIQATSRVGRSAAAPGLVFIIYNTSKPRDKSYYERFQMQHSQLYRNVEPTSVTPFARPLRERALHAIFTALHRFNVDPQDRNNAEIYPDGDEFERIKEIILKRAEDIDSDEAEDTAKQLEALKEEWEAWGPSKYESLGQYTRSETAPLMYAAGTIRPESWGNRGWPTPMSMRNVDRECRLDCSRVLTLRGEYENG